MISFTEIPSNKLIPFSHIEIDGSQAAGTTEISFNSLIMGVMSSNGTAVENEKIEVTRLTEPDIDIESSVVDVNFEIIIKSKQSDDSDVILKEKHSMQYFFYNQLNEILESENFKVVKYCNWLSNERPTCSSWYGVMVCTL